MSTSLRMCTRVQEQDLPCLLTPMDPTPWTPPHGPHGPHLPHVPRFFSCCIWPFFYHRDATHHADLLISPALRSLGRPEDWPAFGLNGSSAWHARDWAAFVRILAKERGALGLHLTHFSARHESGQALPVVAAVLEHALSSVDVKTAGGRSHPSARGLRQRMQVCVDLATDWLETLAALRPAHASK